MTREHVNVYQECLDAGCDIDNHESDLYVRATPEARRILEASGYYRTAFRSQIDGQLWYEVPFAFYPWWEKRIGKGITS